MIAGWILEAVTGSRATEASAVSKLTLDERMSRVCDAIRARFSTKAAGEIGGDYAWPVATYDTHVIFRRSTGGKATLWSIDYEWREDGGVELKGEPVAVVQKYAPLKESAFEESTIATKDGDVVRINAEILGPVLEGEGAKLTGKAWDVLLIQEGMSKNRNRYTRKVLAEAAGLYEKARCFLDHKLEAGPFGRSGAEVMGFVKDVRAVVLTTTEGSSTGTLALAGRAHVTKKAFRDELVEAYEAGNPDFFGLSHDVRADSTAIVTEGGPAFDVTKIRKVESVDWVLNPSAGGRVLRIVASDTPNPLLEESARMLKQMIESLKAAGVAVPENCDEATALRLMAENIKKPATPPANPTGTTQEAVRVPEGSIVVSKAEQDALIQRLEATEGAVKAGAKSYAAMMLERNLLECALPDPFKARIRKRFTTAMEAGQIPTEDQVTAAIAEAVEDVGALREANLVMPHVGLPRTEITKDRATKVQEQLADFFDPSKPLQSFREIYVDITGDTKVTGKLTEAVRRRLSECVNLQEGLTTASFDQILGDSITRRMLKDYTAAGLANWRNTIAEVVPLNDFRTVRRLRFGGYGNLPIVGQGGPYTALTSPTDEEATYSPAKRGGTEQITLEMIKNDDVGAVRRVPSKLARSAAQTLHEFVWDLLAVNAAIYDSVALIASGHNNIVTSAMSAANIASLRLKIKQQSDMSNGKRIGLAARYLIVPSELEESAFQLTTSDRVLGNNNNDPNFVKKLNLETIVVEYWTDTNNYFVTASQDQTPMIEVGFLDGQETPELFVQDAPSVGSMFSNDALTYKIRHIYGAAVMDYRGFAGGIVA